MISLMEFDEELYERSIKEASIKEVREKGLNEALEKVIRNDLNQ